MSNDPDLIDVWIECPQCAGKGTVIEDQFNVTCLRCDGDGGYER